VAVNIVILVRVETRKQKTDCVVANLSAYHFPQRQTDAKHDLGEGSIPYTRLFNISLQLPIFSKRNVMFITYLYKFDRLYHGIRS